MKQMILDGYPLPQIATYIQQEAGEYKDVTHPTLVNALERFKLDEVPAEAMVRKDPKRYLEAVKQIKDSVNVLNELEGMFRIQKARIEKFCEDEEESQVMKPNISREFDAARNILDEIHSVRMDSGMDERHLGTLKLQAEATIVAEERYGSDVAEVLKDPERRRKILAIFESALRVKALPPVIIDADQTDQGTG